MTNVYVVTTKYFASFLYNLDIEKYIVRTNIN